MNNKSTILLILTIIFILFPAIVRTQNIKVNNSYYESAWGKVDSLEQWGLTRSALDVVEEIYKTSKEQNVHPQFVKSILYKLKFANYVEENSQVKIINDVKKEISESTFPSNAVLKSLLANIYWQYYKNNRYKFQQRTETVNFENEDFQTWDLNRIVKEITKHFLSSLEESERLQKIKIEEFEDILLNSDTDYSDLRPTLYDILAHDALSFFINEESSLTQPVYRFVLNSSNDLSKAEYFIKNDYSSKDSLSLKFFAIQLYQKIISFHLSSGYTTALIDADVARMNFVLRNSVLQDKSEFYLSTLNEMIYKFTEIPHSSLIWYNIAKYYQDESKKYDKSVSEAHKWDAKRAIDICDSIMIKYPDTFGADKCEYLKIEILLKSLSFQVENANIPNEPFRALINYKNINEIFCKVISLNNSLEEKEKLYYEEQNINLYNSQIVIQQWSVKLPANQDYQEHSVEIKMPALPIGKYAIMVGTDSNFSFTKNAIAYSKTWVTNLSFIKNDLSDRTVQFYSLDRKTGHPIPDVNIALYYDTFIKIDSSETDSDGSLIFDLDNYSYSRLKIIFSKGFDRFESDNFYNFNNYDKNQKEVNSQFFLDRAIYRPGQTVYFKGLMYATDYKKDHEVITDRKTTVTFYDANRQKISDTTLTTNEYGTFNGKFTIPYGKIGGYYIISNEFKEIGFRVEEYKRPKFEVKFEPVKSSYSLDDKITITGSAKTYSGANLNDAEVKFRVVRNTSFPYYNFRWANYYNWCWRNRPQTEIVNGVTKTDNEGKFTIEFNAVPDLAILRETNPVFQYSVTSDVVDVTGETRSAQSNVSVGYIALNINIDVPEIINSNSDEKFNVATANLNGQFEPAQVSIEVYKLKSTERVFRKRFWKQPDEFLFTKDEYYNIFRNDVYDDEDKFYNWEKENKVFELNLLTTEKSKIEFVDKDYWQPGKYIVTLKSKDKNGTPVELSKYFTLFNPESKKTPLRDASWIFIENKEYEPSDAAKLYFGTALNNVKVLYELEQNGDLLDKKWIELNDEQKLFEIEIEEKHRGSIAAHISFIVNNESHIFTKYINVPWTNKKLSIEFETFRDKITPGIPEKWSLKISGPDGDAVAAELLASMYDASLDQFAPNYWGFNVHPNFPSRINWASLNCFGVHGSVWYGKDFNEVYSKNLNIAYPILNTFGFSFDGFGYKNRYIYYEAPKVKKKKKDKVSLNKKEGSDYLESSESLDEVVVVSERPMIEKSTTNAMRIVSSDDIQSLTIRGGRGDEEAAYFVDGSVMDEKEIFEGITARKNLNETAFFYPELRTNEEGEIIVSFTAPEALTSWKFMGFAFTEDFELGFFTKQTVSQKELMIQPNPPRFLREGDEIYFNAKVSNLSEQSLSGSATLQLFDAFTMQPVDELFENTKNIKSFNTKKGMSEGLSWRLKVPLGKVEAIVFHVLAKSGNFSDGEENALPVLVNRLMLTETLPLPVNGNQTKTFILDKLANNTSSTLQNYNLTLEFTSNPAWYAIQALPYLMEFPYECSEQIFSRLYANSIATHIANSNPKIKKVFDAWKTVDKDALLSNLEKNQELKYALLEETPWVLNAQNESERKRRIGLLFDLTKMADELGKAELKLKQNQYSNGGWPWFPGLPESRYITQHIISGMGHLDRLGIKNIIENKSSWEMLRKAIGYADIRMFEDYEYLKRKKISLTAKNISYTQIQYLYGRSYFLDIPVDDKFKEAFDYWNAQAKQYWLSNNKYMQGMIALALYRYSETETAKDIIKSIIENAVFNDEMGMYFKEEWGWYWYQAPIETQALLIEAVDEITNDQTSVDLMKTWLLKQKQTQDWKTTKATAEACYALLLRGTDWLAETKLPYIKIGDKQLELENNPNIHIEAGTGYFKTSWKSEKINPEMAKVTVTNNNNVVSWGALYWQYFEQLDKITPAETPLKIDKQLFLELDSEAGKKITPVDENTKLKPGDKIKVRIEIRVDRDMEFVHLKDMRAAGFEPLNVLSTHKYQDGLYYYENTRDAATNFFIDRLPKGTYVFEYPLRVTYQGEFSNGITTIQCMYAPEFSSHSEGIRVKVDK